MLHTGPGLDVKVGKGVSIGHGAIVHGCTVGDHCLIEDARHDPERRGHRGRLPDRCRGTGAGGDGYPCGQPLSSGCRARSCARSVRSRPPESKPTKKNICSWRKRTKKCATCRGRRPRRPAGQACTFRVNCRAASPLAAAEGSRPLPTKQPVKGCQRQRPDVRPARKKVLRSIAESSTFYFADYFSTAPRFALVTSRA